MEPSRAICAMFDAVADNDSSVTQAFVAMFIALEDRIPRMTGSRERRLWPISRNPVSTRPRGGDLDR